jgi:hypothetical protein
VRTPELTPPFPLTQTSPTGNTSAAQCSEIVNLLAGFTNCITALPCAEFVNHNEDTLQDNDLDSDMMTDKAIYIA